MLFAPSVSIGSLPLHLYTGRRFYHCHQHASNPRRLPPSLLSLSYAPTSVLCLRNPFILRHPVLLLTELEQRSRRPPFPCLPNPPSRILMFTVLYSSNHDDETLRASFSFVLPVRGGEHMPFTERTIRVESHVRSVRVRNARVGAGQIVTTSGRHGLGLVDDSRMCHRPPVSSILRARASTRIRFGDVVNLDSLPQPSASVQQFPRIIQASPKSKNDFIYRKIYYYPPLPDAGSAARGTQAKARNGCI